MSSHPVQVARVRTHRLRRVLAAGALLLAAAFAPGLAAQNGTLSGVVNAPDGAPLPGGALRLSGGPGTTSDGTYRLSAPAGTYDLTVSRLGMRPSGSRSSSPPGA